MGQRVDKKSVQQAYPAESEDYPVRPPLSSQMHLELMVNDDSQVWLLHDKPFSGILKWVEYDEDTNLMTLVTEDGMSQNLGIVIPEKIGQLLLSSQQLTALLMNYEGQVGDFYIVPLMARGTVFH